jgi:hypothetical protein
MGSSVSLMVNRVVTISKEANSTDSRCHRVWTGNRNLFEYTFLGGRFVEPRDNEATRCR